MKKILLTSIVAAAMLTSCGTKKETNPFFTESTAPFGAPMFNDIKSEHFMPAFLKGFEQQNAEIEAIINNPETPTFANTIAAYDKSGAILQNVGGVFYNLTSAETNDELKAIQKEVSPLSTEHGDNIMLNDKFFQRVKFVYDNKENEQLTEEELTLLDNMYKDFVRSGALLSDSDKEKLKELNKQLGLLSIKFADNVLAETNSFKLVIDNKDQLAGLPEWVVAGASEEAAANGMEGKWVFTLAKPSLLPFLQYSDVRELREKIYKGYINRGDNDNDNNNKEVIAQFLKLRLEKANLLGFDSFADLALDNRMANSPDKVYGLLNKIWASALPKAKEEAADMQKMMNAEGKGEKLEAWNWCYYTEKIRKAKYDLDESELKPYFMVDNVRDGAFMVANKLWGLTFTELNDVPVYHPDVKAFEVKDKDGSHIGLFYVDYFPRAGKKVGAWMSSYRKQQKKDGENIRPIIVNVGNFSKPVGDTPSLLTIDETETLLQTMLKSPTVFSRMM